MCVVIVKRSITTSFEIIKDLNVQGKYFLLIVRCFYVKLVYFFVIKLNIGALTGVTSHVADIFTCWHGTF